MLIACVCVCVSACVLRVCEENMASLHTFVCPCFLFLPVTFFGSGEGRWGVGTGWRGVVKSTVQR